MKRKIVTVPNPILRQKAKLVSFDKGHLSKKYKSIVEDLKETAVCQKDPQSLGLAAPQIGQSFRIFVAKLGEDFTAFINPKIVKCSKSSIGDKTPSKDRLLEGCLSIPGFYGLVDRPFTVTVKWQDETGKVHLAKFSDKESAYIQHEYDHLDGILFVDLLLKQKNKIYQIEKDDKGEETLVEVEWQ